MSKINFFNEPKAYKEQISRYFPDTIPVTFDHLKEHFNITIFGMDIPLLKKIDNLDELHDLDDIAGIALIDENNINLIYNNNVSIDVKEQRFALATLIGYCENLKGEKERPSVCKRFSSMQKCDDAQDNISREEFQEYVNNNCARQILMPQKWFEMHYDALSKTCSFEDIVERLSELYVVPKRQVEIRCKELGYIVSIDSQSKINIKK